MRKPTRKNVIPNVPTNVDPASRQFLEALRETMQVMQGQRGKGEDRAVTFADLEKNTSAVVGRLRRGGANIGGDVRYPELSAPTGVAVFPFYESVLITWDWTYNKAYLHTEIFRTSVELGVDGTPPLEVPGFNENSRVTTVAGNTVSVQAEHGYGYYFWVRHVNQGGKASAIAGPFYTTPEILPSAVWERIEQDFRDSPLYDELRSAIGAIDLAPLEQATSALNQWMATAQQRLTDIDGQFSDVHSTMDTEKQRLDALSDSVTSGLQEAENNLGQAIQGFNERADGIDQSIDDAQQRISSLTLETDDRIKGAKQDLDDAVSALNERDDQLGQGIADAQQLIDSLALETDDRIKGAKQDLNDAVSALNERDEQLTQGIADASTALTTATANLNSSIADLNSQLQAANEAINAAATQAGLDQAIGLVNTRIGQAETLVATVRESLETADIELANQLAASDQQVSAAIESLNTGLSSANEAIANGLSSLGELIHSQGSSIANLEDVTDTHASQISALTNRTDASESEIVAIKQVSADQATSITGLTTRTGAAESKINTLETTSGEQATQIAGLLTSTDDATSEINSLKSTTATQATQLDTLTTRVGSSENEITDLKETTDSQASVISGLSTRTVAAESKISSLETTTAEQATAITSLGTRAGDAESEITDIKQTNAGQATQISGLTTRTGNAESKIGALETTTAEQATQLVTLGTRAGTAESNINILQNTTAEQADSITALTSRADGQDSEITNIKQVNADQATQINNLGTRTDTAESSIDTLQTTTAGQATQLSGLTTRTGTAESKISTLETTTATHSTRLSSLGTYSSGKYSVIRNLEQTTAESVTLISDLTTRVGESESGITSLNSTTANQATQLTGLSTRMGDAESGISTLSTTTADQATQLTGLTTRTGTAESKIGTLETTTATHSTRLNSLGTYSGGKYSVINSLQQTDAEQALQISGLLTRVGDAESEITSVQSTTANQATQISGLTTRTDTAESKIGTLETTTGAQATQISGLTTRTGTAESKIGTLETTTATQATRLSSLGTYSGGKYSVINSLQQTDADQAQQISGLLTRVGDAESEITSVQSTTASQATQINGLTTRTGTAEGKISTLETTTATHSTRLSSLGTYSGGKYSVINSLQQTDADQAQQISGLTTRTGAAESEITDIKQTNEGQATQISGLTTRTGTAESKIGTLETTTATQATRLNSLGAYSGGKFAVIKGLEETTADSATRLNTLTTRTDTAESSIDTLQTTTANQASQITGLTTRTDTAESSIGTLQTTTANQATQVSGLTTRTGTAEGKISTLETTTATHSTRLNSLGTYSGGKYSVINSLQQTDADQAQQISGLLTRVGDAESEITSVQSTTANQATQINGLTTRTGTAESKIGTLETTTATQATRLSSLGTYSGGKFAVIKGLEETTADSATRLNSLTTRTGTAESSIGTLQTTTANQATQITGLTTRTGTAEGKISTLETTSATHSTRLNSLGTYSSGKYSVIKGLEETTADSATKVADLTTRTGAAESNIGTLQTTTATQATALGTLTTRTATAESNIGTLQTTTGNQAQSLSSLTTRTGTAEGKISTLETTTATHSTRLNSLGTYSSGKYSVIKGLEETTADSATKVTGLTTRMGAAESSITTLTGTTASQATQISGLTTRTGTAESKIGTLETTTATHATRLNSLGTYTGGKYSSIKTLEDTTSGHASRLSSVETVAGNATSAITTLQNTTSRQALSIDQLRYSTGESMNVIGLGDYGSSATGEIGSLLDNNSWLEFEPRGLIVTGHTTHATWRTVYSRNAFSIDPSRRYRMKLIVTLLSAPTEGTGIQMQSGFFGLDGAFAYVSGALVPRYVQSVSNLNSVGQRLIYEVDYTGESTSTSSSLEAFETGTKFARLRMRMRYAVGARVLLESMSITDITNEAALEDRSRAYVDQETGVLKAQRTIKVDADGNVAGIGLLAEAGIGSQINLRADRIRFVNPGNANDVLALAVQDGQMVATSARIVNLRSEDTLTRDLRTEDSLIVGDDAQLVLPAGSITPGMLEAAFRNSLVRVDPTTSPQGGTAVAAGPIIIGTYTSTESIEGGGNAIGIELRINQNHEETWYGEVPRLLQDPVIEFTLRRGTSGILIPQYVVDSIPGLVLVSGQRYRYTGKASFTLASDEALPPEQRIYTAFSYMTVLASFVVPGVTTTNQYSIQIHTGSGLEWQKGSVRFEVSEPLSSPGGYVVNTNWTSVQDKPATATRWPTWAEVTGKPLTFVYTDDSRLATNLGQSRNATTYTVTSSTGSNTALVGATSTHAGVMVAADKSKLDGIAAGAQVNVATNLGQSRNATTYTVTSSTGSNTALAAATTTNAGVMAAADKSKLDGIAAGAQVNVATNLGYTASSRVLTSSTGTNVTLPEATASAAGLMVAADKTKLDGIAAGAQVNVATNLGSSGTGGTRTITSSTGSSTSITYTAGDLGAVPAARTITAGDGLSGGGNLTTNRTLSVDSTVVRTSGNQTIGGVKTLTNNLIVSSPSRTSYSLETAQLQVSPTSLVDNGLISIALKNSTSLNYGWSINTSRGVSSATPTDFSIRQHNNTVEGIEFFKISNSGVISGNGSGLTGTAPSLRAQATTKADVGLSGIPNTNGSTANFLRGDGSWATPPNTNTTYSEITTAEIDAGTASTLRTITGRRIKYAVDAHGLKIGTTASTAKAGNWMPTWANVTDKPTTFTPSAHTHTWAQVTGAPAQATRWPTFAEVTGKPATYSPSAHTHDDRYNVTHKYNAVVRQGTWSRIAETNVSSLGGTYLLAVNHTRNSVVVSALFLVSANHSNSARISQLISGNYTQIQVRLTPATTNNVYIEVMDTASGTGDHSYQIRLECVSAGNATPYTSFTAGGGTVMASIQSASTDFIGSGSGLTSLNASNLSSGTVADDRLPSTAVRTSRSISAGPGLIGGGNLTVNRTISVSFGTTEGTVAQGNDSRLSNSREWTASTVSQAEAEAGTATTSRKWTAQRVSQAISALGLKIGTTATTAKAGNWTPAVADIPDLPASKITSGTFATARIPTLNQNTTGNAATATTLATARTLTIGSTGKTFNGSANVSWTVAEIGAAPTGRTITAGNGLTGGGDLSANRTITLGTPTSITGSSTNSVASSGHTHALSITGSDLNAGGTLTNNHVKLGTAYTVYGTSSNNSAGRTGIRVAEIRSSSSAQKGAFVFRQTASKGAIMHQFHIHGMNYSPAGIIDTIVQVYRTGTNFTANPRVIHKGSLTPDIYVGLDADSNFCLVIGEVGSTWSYPHLTLHAMISHDGASDAAISSWTGEIVTAFTGWVGGPTKLTAISGVPSAETLHTARTINGTSFNGSANITTSSWGTARNISIGGTSKSVNGSGNVTWATSEIAAQTAVTLATARTINGTSFNGSANITTANWGTARNISIGGTSKSVNGSGNVTWATSEIAAQTAVTLATARTINGTSFNGSANITTSNWGTARNISIGGTSKSVNGSDNVTWATSEIAAQTAVTLATARTINGTSFNGGANITTSSWGTARTLTVGSTGKSVSGSGNVSWTLAEIGAAARTVTLSGGDGITTTIGNLTANRTISVDSTVVRTSDLHPNAFFTPEFIDNNNLNIGDFDGVRAGVIAAGILGATMVNTNSLNVMSAPGDSTLRKFTAMPSISSDGIAAGKLLHLREVNSAGDNIKDLFYVDTSGEGYFSGSLAAGNVDSKAISVTAKKAINPYYTGEPEKASWTGDSLRASSNGTTAVLEIAKVAGLPLRPNEKVFITAEVSDSVFEQSVTPLSLWSGSNYRLTLQRSTNGGSTWTSLSDQAHEVAIAASNYAPDYGDAEEPVRGQEPQHRFYQRSFGYRRLLEFVDEGNRTTDLNNVRYRILVARLTNGAGTNMGVRFKALDVEKEAFIKNEVIETGTGTGATLGQIMFVDKETGYATCSGQISIRGTGVQTVTFPKAFKTVQACTLGHRRSTTDTGHRYPPRYDTLTRTHVVIRAVDGNTDSNNTISYFVVGTVAI